jgi:antitoxin YefM
MNAVTYTNLRQNLKTYMDKVFFDHAPLIVTRKNDENVMLVPVDEYNSLVETTYLLSNAANAEHLARSINQYRSGQISEHELVQT